MKSEAVLYSVVCQMKENSSEGCNTFSMTVHFRELKQGVGMIRLCT
jgi:hypothetical protein